jgi:hypothetical protein
MLSVERVERRLAAILAADVVGYSFAIGRESVRRRFSPCGFDN